MCIISIRINAALITLTAVLSIFICRDSYSQSRIETELKGTWQTELKPPSQLAPPVCTGPKELNQKSSKYILCLPSSTAEGVQITVAGNLALLKGKGLIRGPILVKTDPPMILIGAMKINKGAMELSMSKGGSFTMRGVGGMFEIGGLMLAIRANKPLMLDNVQLEFTSPEDALLKLSASGQDATVVVRVSRGVSGKFIFTPSPTNFSIFPPQAFFTEFEGYFKGRDSDRKLMLYFKDGLALALSE